MKYIFRYALLSIVLVLATPVVAETLDDGFKAYVDEDYATALRIFRPLAEQGDADAQTYLGYMYSNGLGVHRTTFLRTHGSILPQLTLQTKSCAIMLPNSGTL